MTKIKKITLGTFSAFATVAIPVATVVSCGDKDKDKVKLFVLHGEDDGSLEKFLKEHTKNDIVDVDFDVKQGDKIAHIKKGDTYNQANQKIESLFN